MRGLRLRLRSLRGDVRGTSAIEFAILAPLMILVFFGLVEVGQVVLASRRTAHAASTISDLVAQQSSVSTSATTDDFAAAQQVMTPMSPTSLQMKVTSVTLQSNGTVTVDWSDVPPGGGLAADIKGATYPAPAGMLTNTGDSMIVGTAIYTLTQASSFVLANGISFKRVSYAKPRAGGQVTHSSS